MARRDALLRLHKSLLGRRADLRKKLAGALADLRNIQETDSTGDSADAAFDAGSDEMASQLAEFDARELGQIERALVRLKQGTYGLCEVCQAKIPVARLNALPYTTFCIGCQREMERFPDWEDRRNAGNWEKVFEAETPLEDQREVDISDLELDLSK
ncbi:MAG TPA: TraR/DksA C4-type zinc finger protein [Gemmataceae bacterium]|nr:TraR/DksA C4-type zinc finger protein [Gemmataceae bacterium]